MATNPVLRFHDGKLDVPEELQRDWKLHEGSELRVVSCSGELIVLESGGDLPGKVAAAIKDWRSLEGVLPDRSTAEWRRRLRRANSVRQIAWKYFGNQGTQALQS